MLYLLTNFGKLSVTRSVDFGLNNVDEEKAVLSYAIKIRKKKQVVKLFHQLLEGKDGKRH